jgi:formyltetrahydrofolate synthetase
MAILVLATHPADLRERLGPHTRRLEPTGGAGDRVDSRPQEAMAALLKGTLQAEPVADVGENSRHCSRRTFDTLRTAALRAGTKMGLKLADYCVTEAGSAPTLERRCLRYQVPPLRSSPERCHGGHC